MADLSDKVSESEMSSLNPSPERGGGGANLKTCADCGTSKTPLWRGGPDGPKSLCNACGIRSRKKRRALLGINKEEKEKKVKKTSSCKSNSSTSSCKSSTIIQINHSNNDDSCKSNSSSSGENNKEASSSVKYGESLKEKLMAFGRDFVMQRPRSKKSKSGQRRKMGEEEQAAFLLMAMSCGSVYA